MSLRPEFCISALAALLLAAAPASAQQQPAHGIAATPCAQFVKAARSSGALYHEAANWLYGYVAGMNAALKTTALTNEQMMKSAGDFCEANPSRTIAEAASAWSQAVPKPAVVQEQAAPAAPRTYDHLNKPFQRGPQK